MVRLEDYSSIAGPELIENVQKLGARLAGTVVQHINSTAVGGGVAEILKRLVPLMENVGLKPRWDVLSGSDEFFRVTKVFHNAFHGRDVGEITEEMFEIYRKTSTANFGLLDPQADFVVLHDQQPLGLAERRDGHPGRWIWYCHIDTVYADRRVWEFLSPYAAKCDAAIYHLPEYAKNLGHREYIMPPAIDPLSDKNRDVTPEEMAGVLERLGVPTDLPLIVQISRFDRLKDPVGVIRAFRMARQEVPCRLVLAGGGAHDDPEGAQVLEEVHREAAGDPDIMILCLPPTSDLEINVLQRAATVVVQKSVREGFGLTVTEAMWKEKPVVASPVGGINVQVLDGETGLAARNDREVADAVVRLLKDPELRRRLGKEARERVRRYFILPVYLERWLELMHAERDR